MSPFNRNARAGPPRTVQLGADRHRRPTSQLTLDIRERKQLTELAARIDADPTRDPFTHCAQAAAAAALLPPRVARMLRDFAEHGSRSGILVIAGLPRGKPPLTPPDNTWHLGEKTLLARCQAILNHGLGQMIAYEAEGYGRLYQDMVPKAAAESTQTSLSSRVELELHTEQAFSELRPDWISLACLRGNPQAATYVLHVGDILAQLSPDEAESLRQPQWVTGVDESFRVGGHEFIHGDQRGPFPIIAGPTDDPTLVLDQDLMRGVDAEAQRLFEKVLELYPAHRRTHVLKPGELLLLDNRRAVHGRSPFQARWDGLDRFIIRTFVVRELSVSEHARNADSLTVRARFS